MCEGNTSGKAGDGVSTGNRPQVRGDADASFGSVRGATGWRPSPLTKAPIDNGVDTCLPRLVNTPGCSEGQPAERWSDGHRGSENFATGGERRGPVQ